MKAQKFLNFLLLFGVLVMGIGVYRGEHSIRSYFALKESYEVLNSTVNELHKETDLLSEEILKIKTSKEYAKKVLRDKYHITDDDEKIIFFGDE